MCSDEKDKSNQDCRIMKSTHAHSFGEKKVRRRLLDVVRNINSHGDPAGNYDGYMCLC